MATTLAERIEHLRAKRGLSKNKLGERCGFSAGYVSRLTSAKDLREQLRPETLELLAAALEASFDYIARGAGDEAGPSIPKSWGFSRREVAMRVLVGRGNAPDVVAQAAQRVVDSYPPVLPGEPGPMSTLQISYWIRDIENEIREPGTAGPAFVPQEPARLVESPARYTNRERAILALTMLGRDEAAVRKAADAVAVALQSRADLEPEWWAERIKLEMAAEAHGGPRLGQIEITEDDGEIITDTTASPADVEAAKARFPKVKERREKDSLPHQRPGAHKKGRTLKGA